MSSKIYYSQADPRWANYPYPSPSLPNATIKSGGCGPTCGAMIISSSGKELIYPNSMGDISRQNGFRVSGGTSWDFFKFLGDRWQIETKQIRTSFEAHQACKEGYFVVINVGSGLWTTGGHYILAVGASDTEIEIYDPYLYQGKFDRYGRKGKVRQEGNSCWVEINTFKQYSNAQRFLGFKLDTQEPPIVVDPQIKYVNTNGATLNVRDNPNGKVIGSLTRGTQVLVYEERDGWSRIGDNSWVSSQYLSDTKPQDTSKEKTGFVKTSGGKLNIRKSPSVLGKVVGSLNNGDKVTVYEEKNNWSRIGYNQWVSSSYLVDKNDIPSKSYPQTTVGQTRRMKAKGIIYENPNLTGNKYTYNALTELKILQNISSTVDKVYVTKTGRVGYIKKSLYK